MRLKHITFTGIDANTDINALREIQREFPLAEFGVLTSYHWHENGNRYLHPVFMSRLYGSGLKGDLNLALHICGSAAHDAATGYWEKIDMFTHRCLCIFKRIQLNIANRKDNPEHCWMPSVIGQEIIIQQRNIHELELFNNTTDEHKHRLCLGSFSVLLDGSGGRGIDTPIEILKGNYKVGYAGGMNPDNVGEKLSYLMENVDGDFWIDMESGVRTDDWFDLNKVRKVLEICMPIVQQYNNYG